jgi:sporulation protein YlmC with PRC-barrel domain
MSSVWRALAVVWLGGIASPMLAPPADAGAPNQAEIGPAVAGEAEVQTPDGAAIELVATSLLTGRPIADRDGHPAGLLRAIAVELPTGRVAYALIGSGGAGLEIGGDVIAVPWALTHFGTGPAWIDDTAARLLEAPRLGGGELAAAPPADYLARARAWFRVAPAAQPESVAVAARMLGTLVYGRGGNGLLGSVEEILVDPRRGQVAYCAVSRDVGLRFWTPVPMAALAWSPALGTATLRGPVSALEAATTLEAEPTVVSTTPASLARIYDRYDVRKYW